MINIDIAAHRIKKFLMIRFFLFLALLYIGCSDSKQKQQAPNVNSDTGKIHQPASIKTPEKTDTLLKDHVYSNQRFKDVTVEKLEEYVFRVKGKAQVFEANLSWVVNDGHEDLKKGFQMTTAGAPEWGEFIFTVKVEKKRPNTILTLILFESSAKDGSRTYELPIVLY